MNSAQAEFDLSFPLKQTVKVQYQAWARYRGVIVQSQVRETWTVLVPAGGDLGKAVRKMASAKFAADLQALGSVTNLAPGQSLIKPDTVKIK